MGSSTGNREGSLGHNFPRQTVVSGVYLARLVRSDGDASWRQDNSRYGADIRCPPTFQIVLFFPDFPSQDSVALIVQRKQWIKEIMPGILIHV